MIEKFIVVLIFIEDQLKWQFKCEEKIWFLDFDLYEKREGKKQSKPFPDNNYDLRICTWGASAGRILKENESYAKEVAFYIHNPKMKPIIRDAIERMDVNKEFIFTSTPNILLWQLYEYLMREIPELKLKSVL